MVDTFILLVFALPIVFMLHDFEEIIFLKPWLKRRGDRLPKRLSEKIRTQMNRTTTEQFSLIVAEEFILVSGVTFYGVISGNYYPWFAVLLGFTAHFLMHFVQWGVVRSYIPAIVTTFLALPYCYYAIKIAVDRLHFTALELIFCLLIGVAVVAVNLLFMHSVTSRVLGRSE